eukprot:1139547-Pelagomonas_calceolata.AAC.14
MESGNHKARHPLTSSSRHQATSTFRQALCEYCPAEQGMLQGAAMGGGRQGMHLFPRQPREKTRAFSIMHCPAFPPAPDHPLTRTTSSNSGVM